MKNKMIIATLSAIMSFRMLGLFMILPVFAVAATHFQDATPKLIGITLGIYGLTQALFQIPLGKLSDHLGRKTVIFIGLVLFLIGSIVCALSHSIYILILGRAIQGAGAIGSTVLACVSDFTPDNQRAKAMAFVGLSIGLSFTLAMVAGPLINHYLHLSGIFWLTAVLALIGISCTTLLPAQPATPLPTQAFSDKKLFSLSLCKLYFSIFSLHAILTALFVVLPIILTHRLGFSAQSQIFIYLLLLVFSFICALPLIILAEAKKKMRPVFLSAVGAIAFVIILISLNTYHPNTLFFVLFLWVFFTAFTLLEALLPSLVSKTVSPHKKGSAMGVYSSAQFLGIFVGGSIGGMLFGHFDIMGVFLGCAVLAISWLLFETL